MTLEHVLVVSGYLFSINIYGLITSRNMVRAFMCFELILNAVNINFEIFFSIFVIAILAAEITIGPAIVFKSFI
ncbi:hypothetical protein I3842_11G101700 [Carya illinoinensis]|uniref:NADH dehydrogenase subunit 4L n=1 Tax=Carya illinoinensis TaxID=32201 RepID=A0A922DP13_CARIL|nr:hypothetical protein I3842_11G101700 [Carya illinoinensis]